MLWIDICCSKNLFFCHTPSLIEEKVVVLSLPIMDGSPEYLHVPNINWTPKIYVMEVFKMSGTFLLQYIYDLRRLIALSESSSYTIRMFFNYIFPSIFSLSNNFMRSLKIKQFSGWKGKESLWISEYTTPTCCKNRTAIFRLTLLFVK